MKARLLVFAVLLAILGCQGGQTTTRTASKAKGEDHGHAHERGKMLIADAGKHHALLTAHLSKDGHELDIFFETDERTPKPVPIPMEAFTANVRVPGEDESRELRFECAPAAERPADEKAGTCSHFVAKTPWLKPEEAIRVVARVRMDDGEEYRLTWENFVPKKYAHHED